MNKNIWWYLFDILLFQFYLSPPGAAKVGKPRIFGDAKNTFIAYRYWGQYIFQVFNIFFIRANEKKHVVHCLRCSRQINNDLKGWICLGKTFTTIVTYCTGIL